MKEREWVEYPSGRVSHVRVEPGDAERLDWHKVGPELLCGRWNTDSELARSDPMGAPCLICSDRLRTLAYLDQMDEGVTS